MPQPFRSFTVQASATKTASGNGTTETDVWDMMTFVFYLHVTAASGTSPTLDVIVEDSPDSSNWATVGAFTQMTTTGTVALRQMVPVGRYVRISWTIGGTSPSFTFSAVATARPLSA